MAESPNQSNSMLIDVQYIRPNRKEDQKDLLYMIWKNLDSGEKFLKVIPEPKMDIYFSKPECRDFTHNKNYEFADRLDRVSVKYKDILYAIADDMGPRGRDMIKNAYETRNFQELKKLNLYPYVFASDYDVRAWYRIKWLERFNNSRIKTLDKGFLDIECDSILVTGMPSPTTCPVNAVTIINAKTKQVFTFALMTQDYHSDRSHMTEEELRQDDEIRAMFASQKQQIDDLLADMDGFIDELHERFDDSFGKLEYNIRFYHDERKMLVQLWQLINLWKLDMIAIWNMPFDIPYMKERMEFLGLDPKEYMCHPDFPVKRCEFREDKRNYNVENKCDYFELSSYTIFVDDMVLYAATRKGGTKLRSYSLNSIAHKVLKDKKMDYAEQANIKTLPYLNFRLFLIYNIKDTLLQYGIENKVHDMDNYYIGSYENATPYEAVFKQTVKLRNVQYISFLEHGRIPGNNVNIFNAYETSKVNDDEDDDDDDEGFEGALVADPTYNDYIGLDLYGKPTNNIFEYVIDMDMSSFYPSSIIAMNIDPSTLIFKVIVDSNQFIDGDVKYNGFIEMERDADLAKEVFDNFQGDNVITMGHKWFNLPSVDEMAKLCEEELGGPSWT